jgi:hypothetical protein
MSAIGRDDLANDAALADNAGTRWRASTSSDGAIEDWTAQRRSRRCWRSWAGPRSGGPRFTRPRTSWMTRITAPAT